MQRLVFFTAIVLIILGCSKEKIVDNIDGKNVSIQQQKSDSVTFQKIDSAKIPSSISYNGRFKEGYKWIDKSGENIVFLTETGIFKDRKIKHEYDEGTDAELYAYSYNQKGVENKLNWKVYDFVRDCPVDIVAKFIENSLKITDLDKNGIAEIWMIYKTVCHGDVSPSDMKIIMYEGNKKYAVRGENKVEIGLDDNGKPMYMGGDYKMDDALKKEPKVFGDYVKELWSKNVIEDWK